MMRHDGLTVVHLGPQLLETPGASVADYLTAAKDALAKRPQVVILDEALVVGNEAWTSAFTALLGSGAMSAFGGALVICSAVETAAIKQICSQRWTGAAEWLWQESIKDDDGLEVLEDVLSMPESMLEEPFMKQVHELAWKEPFVEDVIADCHKKGWTLTVLTRPGEGSEGGRELGGFICYVIEKGSFKIARLAVQESLRKGGYGRRLMHWALEKSAQMPRSQVAWISLHALDEAVPFYENFGFTDMTCDAVEDEGHFQTMMELRNFSNVSED
jgi:GNAT superfamily N-acetyltransferase